MKARKRSADINADKPNKLLYPDISYDIRGACFRVWNTFRGVCKEEIVDRALTRELRECKRKVENQKKIPIYYRGEKVGTHIPDKIIDEKVLLELKCKPYITTRDIDQFWRYLMHSQYKLGFLINFGSMKLDIKRVVYDTARNRSALNPRKNPR